MSSILAVTQETCDITWWLMAMLALLKNWKIGDFFAKFSWYKQILGQGGAKISPGYFETNFVEIECVGVELQPETRVPS